MFRSLTLVIVTGLPLLAGIAGCSTAPRTQADQMDLQATAQSRLAEATSTDPTLRPVLDRAAGYAIFPEAGRGGLIVGGGYGKGVLYEHGAMVGYCDMTLASAGAEIGGKQFTEIIVFETPTALQNFKSGQFTLRGDASVVALKSGAAANTQFQDGTAVYVYNQEGLMADASIGAQNFRYMPSSEAQPAAARNEPIYRDKTEIKSNLNNGINDNTRNGVNSY